MWLDILTELEQGRPKLRVIKVEWRFPDEGWLKYNTNGASKGNPGVSSAAFCLRDHKGDLVYAEGAKIDDITNTKAEDVLF